MQFLIKPLGSKGYALVFKQPTSADGNAMETKRTHHRTELLARNALHMTMVKASQSAGVFAVLYLQNQARNGFVQIYDNHVRADEDRAKFPGVSIFYLPSGEFQVGTGVVDTQ